MASVLAGGTDLLVGVRLGTRSPERVVDLKHIPELIAIHVDAESVRIGAAASAFSILHDSDVPSCFPGLAEALDLIGSTQIQGRCSAGGNLCNASPAADSIPALIANGAQCLITGPAGDHQMRVEDFVLGPSKNALKEGELLVALMLPRPSSQTADAYLRLTPRTEMDIAVAGVGVSLTLDGEGTCTAARVSIGAVAPTALLVEAAGAALVGTQLDATAIEAAVAAAREAACPISDKRGTAEYRTHVVGVLVARAIAQAQARIAEASS
jgi:carbon-monoxide dehydrogenase medium subunit